MTTTKDAKGNETVRALRKDTRRGNDPLFFAVHLSRLSVLSLQERERERERDDKKKDVEEEEIEVWIKDLPCILP